MTPTIFLALSEPVRFQLIIAISKESEPITPSILSATLDIKAATISHHLRILEDSALVVSLKSGRNVLYAPNRKLFFELGDFFNSLGQAEKE